MKILAIFTVLIALCFESKAGEFEHLGPQVTGPWATIFTNNATSLNYSTSTNATTTNTFLADKAIYHTFVGTVSNGGTNTSTSAIDTSIDNATWVTLYSTNAAGSFNFIYQFTGVSIYFRERVTLNGTNAEAANLYYAGH